MKQSAFTIVTEVEAGAGGVEALTTLLDEIGDDIDENAHLRFDDLMDLHYASFCVVADGSAAPYLLFEGNVDGPTDVFLRQLVQVGGAAVHEIYRRCAGFPAGSTVTTEDVVGYLLAHDIGSDTFYVAWPGWTVDELRREQELRDRLEELLDELDPGAPERTSPDALRAWVLERVPPTRTSYGRPTPHLARSSSTTAPRS